jgi:hypothetical protein
MKKYIYILFASLGLLTSCDEDVVIYDVDNGQEVVAFNGSASVDLPVTIEGASSVDLEIGVTTKSNSDRTYSVGIDPSSTADPSEYTVSNSVTIPAGEFTGALTVVGNFDAIPDGVTNTLVLNISEPSDGVLGQRDQVTVNLFRFCPSDLVAEFDWTATNYFFQGSPIGGESSGSDAFVASEEAGVYEIEGGFWDFGAYCIFYGLCSGGAEGLQLKEVCSKLTLIGVDQYGDPWEILNVSASGATLSFTYLSGYGEQADVTLTRTDGGEWPSTLFSD